MCIRDRSGLGRVRVREPPQNGAPVAPEGFGLRPRHIHLRWHESYTELGWPGSAKLDEAPRVGQRTL
eukprot:3126309-Alexandrium_andersonii.AAC.1